MGLVTKIIIRNRLAIWVVIVPVSVVLKTKQVSGFLDKIIASCVTFTSFTTTIVGIRVELFAIFILVQAVLTTIRETNTTTIMVDNGYLVSRDLVVVRGEVERVSINDLKRGWVFAERFGSFVPHLATHKHLSQAD